MAKHTPRLIFVRHGQTSWSKSGQYTSFTDLDLTPFGVTQMRNTGKQLIGFSPFHLIQPQNIKMLITSPRKRAKQTAQLLIEGLEESVRNSIPISEDNDLREWEYGDYEGLRTQEIIDLRKLRGHEANGEVWNIFEYGCENGENYLDVTERVDALIGRVRKVHAEAIEKNVPCDVVLVAHGHILRCFASRWIGRPLNQNPDLVLDAGGVGVLSYQHCNINEPAFSLAGAFVVPVEEEGNQP